MRKQSGQTLIEFIFLMASILSIGFLFLKIMNYNLAEVWQTLAQIITEDENLRLR